MHTGAARAPNDELKMQLYSELTGKDKASASEAELLLLGTEVSNG